MGVVAVLIHGFSIVDDEFPGSFYLWFGIAIAAPIITVVSWRRARSWRVRVTRSCTCRRRRSQTRCRSCPPTSLCPASPAPTRGRPGAVGAASRRNVSAHQERSAHQISPYCIWCAECM